MKIVIFSPIWPEAIERLKARHNCVVAINPEPAEKRRLIRDAGIVILRSPVKLDRETLEAARELRLVIRAGMGLEAVDVAYAQERQLQVIAIPLSAESVAEHTFALMLSLYRKIPWLHRSLQENRWEKHTGYGRDLFGKHLGLLGFGRIGIRTAEIAKAFGMTISAHDRSPEKPAKQEAAQRLAVRFVDLDDLFSESDIVSIQAPLTEQTRSLVDARRLGLMKPDAIIINVGRGEIIVEDALYIALKQGRIAGAALDVFASEPPHDHPLLGLDNFVGTPHVAAQTIDAQEKIGDDVVRTVALFEAGKDLNERGLAV